ncbi:hypothetical protein PC116_g14299 [Phytophthora cactorum]|uniref:Uncharacterized protein n=1 Tax=Phytophthora cactorum TaxID=29920 RepID=A0A8T1FY20_9STRA|nr:hypothetical protein PC111_g13736 [Phytophthora cactorum]KAG2823815.1 hypothetical protein PC112_g10354 [Phytophthora cactorum]KAG2857122.1 hypothetical protein PC113_g10975 [Phytophthora cactorum]KAG2905509.1 hypothetical protein PC114_g11499 [Phytophthora cactorum]KAG2921019.1 hypothetical protein PC115_g9643 [Phytophthora cactorum]
MRRKCNANFDQGHLTDENMVMSDSEMKRQNAALSRRLFGELRSRQSNVALCIASVGDDTVFLHEPG